MNDFMNCIVTAAMAFAVMATACTDNNISDSEKTADEKVTTIFSEKTEETTESIIKAESLSVKKTATSEIFSDKDLNPTYDTVTAEITLNGDSAVVDGKGATSDGSCITITQEGVYVITGSLDNGQILVNAENAKVQIVLDNATINCKDSPAIYVMSAKKTFITLADGSENSLNDNSDCELLKDENNEFDSVIFSTDSLTLNGSGKLEISSDYNDGIHSKDDIVITGGNITVNTAGNAIKGKDYVAVADGVLNLTAGKNGIKSTNISDTSKGFVYVEGGTFNITSDGDCIQAQTSFNAYGGDFILVSGGGSANATNNHGGDFMAEGGHGGFDKQDGGGRFGMSPDNADGDFRMHGGDFNPDDFGTPPQQDNAFNPDNIELTAFTQTATTEDSAESISTKGIKAENQINIYGGNFNIDSADDAIHCNSEFIVSGGNIVLSAGGKGIHADSLIEINGGELSIEKSYEGLESSVINVNDGIVEINSSDDGFNASDGVTVQSGMGVYSEELIINITGGIVNVNASGDGLDSNGNINISGGTVLVNGPENSGNGALDSNGEIVVTGGTLVAVGMSGMAEYPSENSIQYCVSATFESTFESNTLITLTDDSGNEIISFIPEKTFNNVIVSSPEITSGASYTFYTGGTSSAVENYGLYENGGYNNDGTESGSFTADSIISFIGSQSAMEGGGGMRGGMGRNGDFTGKHEMPDGENMPQMPDGENMPQMPDGENMPQMPDGNNGDSGQNKNAIF